MRKYFVVCPPGWEMDLARELNSLGPRLIDKRGWPAVDPWGTLTIGRGGIELEAEPLLALQIHFWSRLASRILQRESTFSSTQFPHFENSIRHFAANFLAKEPQKLNWDFQVDCRDCRLGQEKRLESILAKYFVASTTGPKLTLYLRGFRDEFTLSLDMTGDHLHRRGWNRNLQSLAPLRETLAARLLDHLSEGIGASQKQKICLLDPMMGSGTLLSEALLRETPLTRHFAFRELKSTPALLKSPTFLANERLSRSSTWKQVGGFDSNSESREHLQHLAGAVWVDSPEQWSQERVWVVVNPPYGERLTRLESKDLIDLLLKYKPERVGLIAPENFCQDLIKNWPGGWKVAHKKVQNGGLPCFLVRWELLPSE